MPFNMDKPRKSLHPSLGNMMHGSLVRHISYVPVVHGNGFCIYRGKQNETHSEDELVC
jgi:hypothetical protein